MLVAGDSWKRLDDDHDDDGPVYVEVGGFGTGVVGRVQPAVPEDGLAVGDCRLPDWMFARLGLSGEDAWVEMQPTELPTAGTIVLRARVEATLTGVADPVALLTEELTGGRGGAPWAVLCAGSELELGCGVFDVMEVRSLEEFPVPAACILDTDVNLELVPALDAVRPPTPWPAEPAELLVPPEPEDWGSVLPAPQAAPSGFVPFSGKGYRLG